MPNEAARLLWALVWEDHPSTASAAAAAAAAAGGGGGGEGWLV